LDRNRFHRHATLINAYRGGRSTAGGVPEQQRRVFRGGAALVRDFPMRTRQAASTPLGALQYFGVTGHHHA
jgi:hypothetical protein